MNIVDRTSHSAPHTTTLDGRLIHHASRQQAAGQIRGAFLHQTGFVNSSVARYDRIIAHFVVLRSGGVLKIRETTTVLQSVSAGRAIDIEFEGSYPSVRQLRQRPQAPSTPTAPQILAGRALVQHLRSTLGIAFIWAHRQASMLERDNCPGPHLWYNVGEWAIAQHGLASTGLASAIPPEWQSTTLELILPSPPLPRPMTDAELSGLLSDIRH